LGQVCLSQARQTYEVPIRAEVFNDGMPYLELSLLHDAALVTDGRSLTALYHRISLREATTP